ncbi:MAG: hypothetical protein JSV49_02170, partial [Thermoplasmata archaeon]
GDYTLRFHHVDFNITYTHVKDFTLGEVPFEYSFNMIWSTEVNGTVYWDRNNDGVFTRYWFDHNTSSLLEDALELDDGSGDAGGGSADEEVNLTRGEDPLLVKEGVQDVELSFIHENGTTTVITNITGQYSAYIQPGEYTISINDERFEPADETVPDQLLKLKINDTPETHVPPVFRDFSLQPENVNLRGTIWYDSNYNSNIEPNETTLPEVKLTLTNASLGSGAYEATADQSGQYQLYVLPGVYNLKIEALESGGVLYSYLEDDFIVPLSGEGSAVEGEIVKNIPAKKYIKVNYTAELSSSSLPPDELTSTNLTLHIYDKEENEVELIPVEGIPLGGYMLPGSYSLWLEYYKLGNYYLYLGTHEVESDTRDFNMKLEAGVRINGTVFNDTSNFGVIDINEWLSDINITLKPEDGSGGMIKLNVGTGLYSVYVLPDVKYSVHVNTTKLEMPESEFITVRYLFDDVLYVGNLTTSYNLELIKYINITGFLFYNIFESDLVITPDAPTGGDEIITPGGDLGKLIDNAKIIFTELPEKAHPEIFTAYSNATGNFNLYLRNNIRYNITLERTGFEQNPTKIKTFEVTEDNSTLNLQCDPSFVTLSGRIYSAEDDSPISDVNLELILYYQDVGTIYTVDNIQNGEYSIELLPEKYSIYGYTPEIREKVNQTSYIYRSLTYLDALEMEIGKDKEMDIAMLPGVRVYGNIRLYDADNNRISDITRLKEDGEGLVVSSDVNDGVKHVDISKGFYRVFLPYGNYSLSSETRYFEYDMNMTYKLDEFLPVTSNTGKINYELKKQTDYRFEFKLKEGEYDSVTVSPVSMTNFKLELNNIGNSHNTITLSSSQFPDGWLVEYDQTTVELPINGETTVVASVTTVSDAFHDNSVDFDAASEKDPSQTNSVGVKMMIPAIYNYDFYTQVPHSQGINYNDSLEFTVTIENLGNAQDTITIRGPDVLMPWNVTIDGQPLSAIEPIPFNQVEVYKNVTMKVTSPDITSGRMIGETLTLNLIAHSDSGNKSIELPLEVVLNMPDLLVKSVEYENLRLNQPDRTNVTFNATVKCELASAKNVKVSLFIDGKSVDNFTIARMNQGDEVRVKLAYETASANKGEHTIQVIIDPENVIEERNEFNNEILSVETIGPVEEEEEFNWRPYAFLSGLILFLAIVMVYWRWKRKV